MDANDIVRELGIKCCRLCEGCYDDLDEAGRCAKCNSQHSNFKLADEAADIIKQVYDAGYEDGWG